MRFQGKKIIFYWRLEIELNNCNRLNLWVLTSVGGLMGKGSGKERMGSGQLACRNFISQKRQKKRLVFSKKNKRTSYSLKKIRNIG